MPSTNDGSEANDKKYYKEERDATHSLDIESCKDS